jgi:F-box interacting protein
MSPPTKKPKLWSVHVPNELVYDILTQLPVKSLIRFRCVSKSCNSIISNPNFIKTNFNFNRTKSLSNNNNHNGYLHYTPVTVQDSSSCKELCTVVCNSDQTLTHVSRFEIPFVDECIFGFCNGMVCLASADARLSHLIYLWNPSIRKFKMLNATPLTPRRDCIALGLAYHSQNNDFKILRIVCREPSAEAEIYTLSTDSWRKVVISEESEPEPNIGSIFEINEKPCLFFNGALHSIAYSENHYFILSFDVNDERFRNIMLPPLNYLVEMFPEFDELVVFKEMLALIVIGKDVDEITGICHIWVMKEYGVVESWTKICVSLDSVNNFYGCNDNGALLIKNATGLVLFDPSSLNENVLAIEDTNWVRYTTNSMESLVLLDGSEHED